MVSFRQNMEASLQQLNQEHREILVSASEVTSDVRCL